METKQGDGQPPCRRGLPTIRTKLAWLVIFCALPGVLGFPVLVYHHYDRERAQLEREMVQTTRALASVVDRELTGALVAANTLATSPHLAMRDLSPFYGQAREVLQTQIGDSIVLSDRAAQQIVNTARPFGEPLPRHGNLDQLNRVFETGRPVVSDLYVGGLLRRPLVSIDVPVLRNGHVTFDLSIGIFPERLGEILGQQRLPAGWIAAVFDSNGIIVARSQEPGKFVGKKGTPILVERMQAVEEGLSENNTLEGVPVFGAFTRSTLSRWTIAVGVPRETLLAPLRHSVLLISLGVVALLAVGFGFAWVVGGRIARSVRALIAPALALGSGGPVVVPPLLLKESDEVARALVTASGLLRKRTAERDEARDGANETQRLLQDVIDASSSLIYLFDSDGRCLQINRAFCALFVRPAEEILGLQRDAFLPPEAAAAHQANDLAVLDSGETIVAEEIGFGADGPRIYLSVKFPVRNAHGTVYAIGGISTDITERKRIEAELERYRRHLENDVAERTQALEDALAELRDSEERFRSTFEQAATGFIHTSFEGKFLRFNKQFCEIIGYPAEEVPELTYQLITHPDDLAVSLDEVARIRSGEAAASNWEKRYIRKDGAIVWVRLTVSIQHDADGVPQHFITIIEDISARKRAEEMLAREAARYEFLLKIASDGIHVLDEYGNLREASNSFLAMLGYTADQAVSLNVADWDAGIFGTGWRDEFPRIMASQSLFETKHRRRDGTLFDVEVNCHGVEFEGQHYLYASSRDITERKALAEALLRSHSDLEHLAYVASHDLQEPVRTIVSFSQLLERQLGDKLGREDREYLDFIVGGAKRMSALVHDLLAYSNAGASQKPHGVIDAAEVVAAACANLGALIFERGAEIEVEALPNILGERTELTELFQNLVTNAIKFTPAETIPKIRIAAQRKGSCWEFSVSDNGIGISQQYHDQIFIIFQRLHTSQAYPGTGIGLALCKRIVERHGGKIWIESQPDGGTVFLFTIDGAYH